MSAAPIAPAPPSTGELGAPSATPTTRAFVKRWSFWIAAGAFVIVASIVLLLVRGTTEASDDAPLSITSPAPSGSKALAEVLRQQGVTVTAVSTLDDAEAAVAAAASAPAGTGSGATSGLGQRGKQAAADTSGAAGASTGGANEPAADVPTLLIFDPDQYLPGDRYAQVKGLAARLVLVQPDVFELEGIAPSISAAGAPDGPADNTATVAAGCSLPAAEAAGSITVSGTTYRQTGAASGTDTSTPGATQTGITSCFASGDDAYSLVSSSGGAQQVSVLGAADVLNNEQIVNAGNAALALGLLGHSTTLIWYTPSTADVVANGPPSLGALTPGWVTPLILLLVVVFIAAAVWRGRRLGPVVVENLPVIVRGNETVLGRARLYARSGARLRAADALRIGASGRLARMLGLPRTAPLDDIILQTSAALGIAPAAVADVLVNRLPRSEADLLELSTQLADLERAVRLSVYGTPAAPPARQPTALPALSGSPTTAAAPSVQPAAPPAPQPTASPNDPSTKDES
ncbi:DUF4350 domain-containing protein [Subtercola lobariae]|uniref:DUF4350 domain-containing protein n=1 Tax=Subtercola lobariae TaxID=1588641 RepID=A0A917B1C1_9MICO|nr:DUF4350 domain-containing protein [Subtercola lobariae]GGF14373.1 hypothetical protein GCM10011399_05270 [Subtercola lobariae]